MTLPGTSVQASLRGITATSIDGNEISFEQTESTSINLSEDTYLTEPRMIASRVNEVAKNTTQPGGKSMELTLTLSTANANVSPVIDLDRVGMTLISNRVNAPISDYANDPRTASLEDDPTAFVYANKPVELENAATSLKVLLAGYVNTFGDIRAFYSISNLQKKIHSTTHSQDLVIWILTEKSLTLLNVMVLPTREFQKLMY